MALDSDTCRVCFLESSKGAKVKEVAELLEALLVQTNLRLFEELLICDNCLIKIQSASKFKAGYLEKPQKLCIKQEGNENEAVCEICKENVNPTDCLPLFYSLTENDKLNLFKFLSSELELKSYDSRQTCELCHKSILNFCIVIKSFSVVVKDNIFNETDSVSELKAIKLNSNQDKVNSVVSTDDFTIDIKEEAVKDYTIDITESAELKQEQGQTTAYEDFLCKNEELDLKTEDEPVWSYDQQEDMFKCLSYDCYYQTRQKSNLNRHMLKHKTSDEVNMFNCQICDFQTKHKDTIKRHAIVHKDRNEIKMFKCEVCEFQTKFRHCLKNHMTVHKNPNEIEMFKCQICDFQTKYRAALKRHAVVHKNCDEIQMFKCQICNFQTKYKGGFKIHLILHKNSNEIKMFKCHMCDFQTKHKYYIKQHMLKHRNGNEIIMVKCHICDYQTKYKGALKRHLVIHKGSNEIEMFKCNLCNYQTKFKNHLKRHTVVHKNSNEFK